MNNQLGLVLAGGGGKGSYHIGVWRVLRDYGVEKNIENISGTSVGALNAALFATENFELAEKIWLNLDYTKILAVDLKKILIALANIGLHGVGIAALNLIVGSGIFTRNGLLEIINKNLDFDLLKNSQKKIFAGAFNVSKFRMEYLKINGESAEKIKKILLATSAIPVVYPPENIDGQKYIDGGVMDNVPIEPLYNLGCKNFLVVHLSRDGMLNVGKRFDDARIIEIVPSNDQGDFLSGTMDFSRNGILRRMEQGYNDTCEILEKLYKMGIVQKKIFLAVSDIKNSEENFHAETKSILDERREIKNQREILKKKFVERFRFEEVNFYELFDL